MASMDVRIDKWLWAVRIFKTRSLANTACRKGAVRLNGVQVRSSKTVKTDDLVTVSFPGIDRIYRVMATIEKRVGAKLAAGAVREETDPADLERLELIRRDPLSVLFAVREPGSGRPSKKERRDMSRFLDPQSDEDADAQDDQDEDPEEDEDGVR